MTARTRVKPEAAPEPVKAEQPLHTKYRPQRLEDVVGQPAVVKSLASALRERSVPHAFLFTGPAGTGKTTMARIVASMVGCQQANVLEVDAASTSGIDDMRTITDQLRYQGFGDSPAKMVIVDECHALSKQAWQALLKNVEEPAPHVFWAFCTTDSGKVPSTISSRCLSYDLRPLRRNDVLDLLEDVCKREDLDTPGRVLEQVADACEGSARRALVMLAQVANLDDADEIAQVLAQPLDKPELIELCRALVKGDLTWATLTKTLKELQEPAESVRIVVVNYLAACAMGARSDKDAARLLDMMAPFSKPFNTTDKNAPLLLAFGDLLL